MSTVTLELAPRGILAQLPDGLTNQELYGAVLDPLCAFINQISQQKYFKVPMTMRRNDAQSIELVIQQFLITAVDLRQARVDFLAWVGKTRAAELLGGELGVGTLRYLVAGIDFADGVMPYGFVIATPDPAFKNPIVPNQMKVLDPWLLYTQLALERTLEAQFAQALGLVHERIGPSMLAAIERGDPPLKPLADELKARFNLGPVEASALMQLGDWHADGGLDRLTRMRAHAAAQ